MGKSLAPSWDRRKVNVVRRQQKQKRKLER
jgi:hypothetical protein